MLDEDWADESRKKEEIRPLKSGRGFACVLEGMMMVSRELC